MLKYCLPSDDFVLRELWATSRPGGWSVERRASLPFGCITAPRGLMHVTTTWYLVCQYSMAFSCASVACMSRCVVLAGGLSSPEPAVYARECTTWRRQSWGGRPPSPWHVVSYCRRRRRACCASVQLLLSPGDVVRFRKHGSAPPRRTLAPHTWSAPPTPLHSTCRVLLGLHMQSIKGCPKHMHNTCSTRTVQ